MEEMIDIYEEKTGEKTGKVILKDEAHRTGEWHSSIHLLIVDKSKKKTLLQKRCANKKLYPNVWDIAVGGHISSGENDEITVRRELKEELGLNPNNYKIRFIKKCKESFISNGLVSNEFVSIFIICDDIDISNIKLQKEEVSEIKWFTREEMNKLRNSGNILPYEEEYIILNDIMKSSIMHENELDER